MAFKIVRTPFPTYVADVGEAEEWHDFFYEHADHGIGFDTETTGLNIVTDRIRFFSFANREARICAPLRLLPTFEPILTDPHVEKRMTNSKYDRHMAMNHGIQIRGRVQDTVDQDFLYDENRMGRHGLKETAYDHLGLRMTPFKEVFGSVGKVDEEVRTMCHVHDILEMHDFEGREKQARDAAQRLLVKLKKIDMDEELQKAFRRMSLSIQAGCKLTARQLLVIARNYGFASKTAGRQGYISDFVEFLGGPVIPNYKDRPAWAHILDATEHIADAHYLLWDRMLELINYSGKPPVEVLRTLVTDYASLDAWASYALVPVLQEFLDEEEMITEGVLYDAEDPETLLEHSEEARIPFVETLWYMERRGFGIDIDRTVAYGYDMEDKLQDIERRIVKITGEVNFNVNSTPQLREQFFDLDRNGDWVDPFGDAPKKMTSGGSSGKKMPSTNKEVLEEFAGKGNELAKEVLGYRQYSKLHGTYMVALPEWADRKSRIHTSLKSHGARTWRLSSANPNLQNIPARDPVWGKKIRQLFVAGFWGDCDPMLCMEHLRDVPVPDLPSDFPMRLLVADYKQLEMRIMAHFSQDEGMIEAIQDNLDLHCQTVVLASERGVPGIPSGISYAEVKAAKGADQPTPDEALLAQKRGELKSTGFGIIYGIGALKLGMQLGLPIVKKVYRNGKSRDWCPVADELIKSYLNDIYPGVGEFIEDTQDQCREELAVYTVIGHPRRLPDIVSRDRRLQAQAERQAPNARIQGSAADITNEAMLRCERDPLLREMGVRLLLQVHDELVFEVPDDQDYVVPARMRIRELMEDPFPMRVPIEIDIEEGYNWGDAKG